MSTDTLEIETWLRGRLGDSERTLLGQGYQATVHRHATPFGDIVVKSPHAGLLGLLARRAIRREAEIYRRLEGIAGIPKFHTLLDDEHLVIENIEGPSYRDHQHELEDRDTFFANLLATLDAMHAAGVAHGDLKRKDNLLVGPGRRPYLIDFGIACASDGTTRGWRRWRFESLKQLDVNAWVKLKYGREPTGLSEADAKRYRPLLLERIARWIRIPWQKITLRRPRQRLRRWLDR